MEEGTVLKWLKSVGDEVAVGDELVEIETDKANMVYEADSAGTLTEIVAQEGDTLPIGEVIARVGEGASNGDGSTPGGGSAVHAPQEPRVHAPDTPETAPASVPDQPEDATASPTQPSSTGERIKASPLARRIAEERGLDLASLSGSGPGGRIVKADVEGAGDGAVAAPAAAPAAAAPVGRAESPGTAKGSVETVELTKLQQTIARRMAESKATAPHFYLQANVDMTRAVAARGAIKAAASEGDVVPSFNDMVVKACAIALRERPRANGAYRDGRLELYSRVNVGVAVAARDALVVPTVFDADLKGLTAIATETRALAARVREGTITPPELSGGTFTVSNLGMYGISNFHAVINTPQAAILSVGAITETPVVSEGEIATAQLMGVTLACDHRILYGADGAELLGRVRALLEEPMGLAL
jgi:pyruvate dehydrogenase E2 component (dihydrolipoamide acetyltransferase)